MEEHFLKTLSSYQREIERELRRFFDGKIKETKQTFLRKTLGLLKEFSLRRAKRIRPILVNQGYFLAGGKEKEAILKTSIFIELIHNYLLIHDDIIDKDKIRRGGSTVHHYYRGGHYGESMAIVVGDLANALGYEALTSSPFPVSNKIRAIEKLNQILYLTGYGQLLELWLNNRGRETRKETLEVYRNKTANYTFVGPLQLGAILAGADKKLLEKIEKFALPLGIAFQIKDDILDVKSDKQTHINEHFQKLAEELISRSKETIKREKRFQGREKRFLLSLADFILDRNA